MPVVALRWGQAIPLWAVALCAVALSTSQRVMPFLITLLAIGVIAAMMPAIARRFGSFRRSAPALDDVLPPAEIIIAAGTRTRTLDAAIDPRTTHADDMADLVRMDDDGGWQMDTTVGPGLWAGPQAESEAPMSSASTIVPGAREPGMLTIFGAGAMSRTTIPHGPSTIDAVTIAERQREGGGAPSQRRPVRQRVRWTGLGGRLHELLVAMRA
jgi:hypothetical protein